MSPDDIAYLPYWQIDTGYRGFLWNWGLVLQYTGGRDLQLMARTGGWDLEQGAGLEGWNMALGL